LNDFVNAEGKPGYFAQQLNVYGRKNHPCVIVTTHHQKTIGNAVLLCTNVKNSSV